MWERRLCQPAVLLSFEKPGSWVTSAEHEGREEAHAAPYRLRGGEAPPRATRGPGACGKFRLAGVRVYRDIHMYVNICIFFFAFKETWKNILQILGMIRNSAVLISYHSLYLFSNFNQRNTLLRN